MRALCFLASLTLFAWPCSARADMVDIGDFGEDAFLTDFNNLGLPTLNAPPLVIGGNVFDIDSSAIRYNASGSVVISGMSGENISNSTDEGFIDVQFFSPVLRAGAVFGSTLQGWTATVSFFDASNNQLGFINIAGNGGEGVFAGWEDSALINRMRVTDTSANGRVMVMDDLRYEFVPEPSSGLCLALLGTLLFRRRRA
ncbi:MAG: PEP-CTERM sorting domain-containing protein [bacterium]|nr:PEP-CTERM sorting domain-containing protein [bacterium]